MLHTGGEEVAKERQSTFITSAHRSIKPYLGSVLFPCTRAGPTPHLLKTKSS
jgi:hypothetical protein